MKFHDDKICLEYSEIVPDIMSAGTYAKNRERKNITVFGYGGIGREILIAFESLPAKYRSAVIEKYGNPYEYMAKEPISEQVLINWDFVAETFYDTWVLPSTQKELPKDYKKKYTEAASWLKTVNHFTTDKRALKRQLNITITEFWDTVTDLIRAKNVALPTNPRSLKNKLAKYNASPDKYVSLVEAWRFGNENTKKVKDETAEALLLQMLAHHNQHDDTIIALKYSEWAKANGRKPITASTVGNYRKENEHLITLQRKGVAANYTKFSKQIHSNRPTAPLLLAVCDDNNLDLYFRKKVENKQGKTVTNEQYRVAMYVVKDYYNDYILGYAIGDTVTKDLIYAAFRNAIEHISELTGGNFLFHQLQSDRWAIDRQLKGELATYFGSLAHFTPGTVKASQTKRIEQSFNAVWHQQLKLMPYDNYAGHNITANQKMNPDAILALKKNYPSVENASQVVAHFVHNMRQSINTKTGMPRQEEWLKAFQASEKSQKRQISNEQRIELFGITHPRPARITSAGLRFDIDKHTFTYDIPDEHYLQNVGKKFTVMYEPQNMDQVLITDKKGLRFIAKAWENAPSALADFKPGDRERLNNLLENKTKMMLGIQTKIQDRMALLSRDRIDVETVLQSGVAMPKEISYQAAKAIGVTDDNAEFLDYTQFM